MRRKRQTVPSPFSVIASSPGAVQGTDEKIPPASGLGCGSPGERSGEAAAEFCSADAAAAKIFLGQGGGGRGALLFLLPSDKISVSGKGPQGTEQEKEVPVGSSTGRSRPVFHV